METFASNIAEKIALQMDYDEDKKAVIAYGLTAIFQMTTILIIISIIGLLFNFWYESILIFFGVGIIRKSTGGAHSHTMNGCIIISVLSITLLSTMSRYILNIPFSNRINYILSILVYILCFIIFYIRVPVDSPNKPIVKAEKISRLRKQSFLILTLFFIISIILISIVSFNSRLYSIAVSIRLTMLWQVFTLTKIGLRFFGQVDSYFESIIYKKEKAS